jgi:hypothetical protein
MQPPPDWVNPITAKPGHSQQQVDPLRLRPSRQDLVRVRLDLQRSLVRANLVRWTTIVVTIEGVIFDGHHAVRVAAEDDRLVDLEVTPLLMTASAASIMDLPVR